MKHHFLLVLLLVFGAIFAQNENEEEALPLSEQFDRLSRRSTSYSKYKAMKVSDYKKIKLNVLDTVSKQKISIVEKTKQLEQSANTIGELDKEVKSLQSSLEDAVSKNNNRYFLGMKLQKSAFTLVLIVTYAVLIALLVFFALKYKSNIVTTKKAKHSYNALLEEYEVHKKTSLKRFQEVNRKLQDELNKKWKKES